MHKVANMEFNLEGKIFHSVSNTGNGDVSTETLFHYHQDREIISADYYGGKIIKGHLIGKILDNGHLDFYYHHVNSHHQVMVGRCLSTPEVLEDGRLRFMEQWQWLSGDKSKGESIIEEIDSV
jgi:hypothetical protein